MIWQIRFKRGVLNVDYIIEKIGLMKFFNYMGSWICKIFDHNPTHWYDESPFVPTRCECSRCGKDLPLYYNSLFDEDGKRMTVEELWKDK